MIKFIAGLMLMVIGCPSCTVNKPQSPNVPHKSVSDKSQVNKGYTGGLAALAEALPPKKEVLTNDIIPSGKEEQKRLEEVADLLESNLSR